MVVAIIALVLLALILGISFVCYRIAFFSSAKTQSDVRALPDGEQYAALRDVMLRSIDEFEAVRYEQVGITSFDGLKLYGRYYHAADNAPIAICFHGYRGSGIRDFSGGSHICRDCGQNLLLVDQRAQGKSEGHAMTFGAKEKYDCLAWINYCINRFGSDVRIYLFGVSMGAATVLLASGLELPKNVELVIADSPYSSAKGILRKVCRDMKLPPSLAYPFIALGANLFAHFRISDADVAAALSSAAVPILIIHGEDDRFVPCEMSRQLQRAYPNLIHLETFPNAGHGLSYMIDKPRYTALAEKFFSSAEQNR